MDRKAIDFGDSFARFSEQWSPKLVARANGQAFKLVRLEGGFVWHRHADTDEVFLVLDGVMIVHFRDGDVPLAAGQMCVIPRGEEHRTSATQECRALIVEAEGTLNTGDVTCEQTAPTDAPL